MEERLPLTVAKSRRFESGPSHHWEIKMKSVSAAKERIKVIRRQLNELNTGKRPEHIEDFTLTEIEKINLLKGELFKLELYVEFHSHPTVPFVLHPDHLAQLLRSQEPDKTP